VTGRGAPRCPSWSACRRGQLVLVNDDDLTYGALRPGPPVRLAVLIDRIADITEPLPRHAVLVGRAWGDDARRGAQGTRLRDTGGRRRGPRTASQVWCKRPAAAGADGGGVVRRAELGGPEGLAAAGRGDAGRWPRAAEASSERANWFAVNSLTGGVLGQAQLDVVAGWLAGTEKLDGLTVDTDLRWRLLHALVRRTGQAG